MRAWATTTAELPPDLPVPEDDGAADHLAGLELPAGLSLPSTQGEDVDLAEVAAEGLLVAYVYPRTGTPGEPLPAGWDDIPGARGCTPQSCAYRDSLAEFARSARRWSGSAPRRRPNRPSSPSGEHIPFPLLSDTDLELAGALGCRPSRSTA